MTEKERARIEWEERKTLHRCPVCDRKAYWMPDVPPRLCPKCGDAYLEEM